MVVIFFLFIGMLQLEISNFPLKLLKFTVELFNLFIVVVFFSPQIGGHFRKIIMKFLAGRSKETPILILISSGGHFG
jgi:hypothetical protein